jgi:universal stress protein E
MVGAWEEEQRTWLGDYCEELNGADYTHGVSFEPVLLGGQPSEALEQIVSTANIGTLVIGTSNRKGLAGLLVGNVAERLIERVGCNLLIVKPEGTQELLQSMGV